MAWAEVGFGGGGAARKLAEFFAQLLKDTLTAYRPKLP